MPDHLKILMIATATAKSSEYLTIIVHSFELLLSYTLLSSLKDWRALAQI
jgi:hypothetical protein